MSWSVPGSLAFVCPRYGTEVLGGAETVVRELAERLAGRGYPVEVLTTCAVDHHTWENHYEPGLTEVNGIPVHRFPVQRGTGRWHKPIGERIGAGVPTSLEEQELWINDGFRSAHLFHHLLAEHERYHTILLTPYMFWTTYACSQIAPRKTVLRPCLHDEVFARLAIYQTVFRDVRGITFNSPPEAELAQELFELPRRWEVVGEGLEVPEEHNGDRFRDKFGVDGEFLIYAGRREWGKNVDWLVELFGSYLERTGRDLRLVLLGRGEVRVPADLRDHVLDLGFVDEQDKYDAFAAATVACQPSLWESFSRLLMDAWLAGTPVLSFGGCAVTAYHTDLSGGGLVFNDEAEFQVGLDVLLDHPGLREEMGQRGRAYVLERYTWDQVVERFASCLDAWAAEDGKGNGATCGS